MLMSTSLTRPDITFTSVTTYVEHFFEGFDASKGGHQIINNYPKYADREIH